jgi:hypothetical protein
MTFDNPISEYSVLSHITKSVVQYDILDKCFFLFLDLD